MEKIILNLAEKEGISDIHISSGKPIAVRINGVIETQKDLIVKNEDISKFIKSNIKKESEKILENEKSIDFSLSLKNFRLRGNAFYSQDGLNVVLRILSENILSFEEINFPPVVEQVMESQNGLILVTGQTGSGKSTSLASIIDYFNQNHQKKNNNYRRSN